MTISTLLSEISARYNLRRKSGKWVGACPECGGSSTSDKFNIRDDGGFKCYACDFKGDIITWLRKMEGMSCPEAHERAGKQCNFGCCQVKDKCRLGNGQGGTKRRYRPSSVRPRATQQRSALPLVRVSMPNPHWQRWAEDLVAKARENIRDQADVLSWLADRGLDLEAVMRFRLGWLDHQYRVKRTTIGLTPEKDGKGSVWVPEGLLIPIYDRNGRIHRLRIRRPLSSRERFLPKLKYVWIDGSGTGPLVIRPQGICRGAVIEEAELDAYATAAAHDEAMVIGIGTVSAGLPESLLMELHQYPVILVSIDADQGKEGKLGAGPKAFANWKSTYRQAKFWPVPAGKDPGDYAKAGGDLNLWIESGLPPYPTMAKYHERPVLPECIQGGDRGNVIAEKIGDKAAKTGAEPDPVLEAINGVPADRRNDVLDFYRIMQGNPVSCWISPDGFDAGILDLHANWRANNHEISDRFSKLFYGDAHEDICRIFRDIFMRNAKIFKKCASGKKEN